MSTPNDPNVPQQAPQYAAPQYAAAPAARTNTMAIIALVASFIISLVGVILGHIALNQIKRTGEGGRGLAIAALIIGYIGLAAWIIVILVWIIALASLSAVSY